MQFFKAISLFSVFFMAMFGLVAATPVTDLKRDVLEARTVDVGAQVIAVLKALQSNITVPLSQIDVDAVLNAGLNVTAEVSPLWLQVIADVEVAVDLLTVIDATALLTISASEKTQIELIVAQIYAAILLSIDVCTEAQLSLLATLFVQLDVNLQALLAICAKLSISLSVIASLLVNLKAQLDVNLSLVAKVLGL